MRNDLEKDPVLSEAEQIGRHREHIIDNAIAHIALAVPAVEAVQPQMNVVETQRQTPLQNVVNMDAYREKHQAAQHEMLSQTRDVIDEIYGEQSA